MTAEIAITNPAEAKIKEVVGETRGLRVKVIAGGRSCIQYRLDIDTRHAEDRIFEKEGATVFIDPNSVLYLNGMDLDYKNDPIQSEFVFNKSDVIRHVNAAPLLLPERKK